MVLQVNDKWKIKFDEEVKQYIFYRIMEKHELAAHLAAAENQLQSIETAITTFQSYIDDPRVPKDELNIES